jgi:hypothetical protein
VVAYDVQLVAVNVVNSTNASTMTRDLVFNFSLLVILLYSQYRAVVLGMLDRGLINT